MTRLHKPEYKRCLNGAPWVSPKAIVPRRPEQGSLLYHDSIYLHDRRGFFTCDGTSVHLWFCGRAGAISDLNIRVIVWWNNWYLFSGSGRWNRFKMIHNLKHWLVFFVLFFFSFAFLSFYEKVKFKDSSMNYLSVIDLWDLMRSLDLLIVFISSVIEYYVFIVYIVSVWWVNQPNIWKNRKASLFA